MALARTDDAAPIAVYRDPASALRFVVTSPDRHPGLWQTFLQGACRSYARYGLESVIEYDTVVDGATTTLFFAALDETGRMVGGLRVQGPYPCADMAHAVQEWAGGPGSAELIHDLETRIPAGVIEVKTGWHEHGLPQRAVLSAAMARTFLHALTLTGARWALCTAADHAVSPWLTSGAVVADHVTPVAYPDSRYRTVPLWWDRQSFADRADRTQLEPILDETAQLLASRTDPDPVCPAHLRPAPPVGATRRSGIGRFRVTRQSTAVR